jgi:hypothetical protein
MKKIFGILCLLFLVQTGFAQTDAATQQLIKRFEKYCPIYVLENYCSGTGLTNILKAARTDDRVGGIDSRNANDPQDPEVAIKYNNVVIIFSKYHTAEHLGIFSVLFNNKKDMDEFASCYKYLMKFIDDAADANRYYFENGSMNAITKNAVPGQQRYFATCFVFQSQYCR